MTPDDLLTTIVFFNTFMAFAKNVRSLQSLATKIEEALNDPSSDKEETEQKIAALQECLEPSERAIILLRLIYERPDQFTVQDIARITKTRERVVQFHLDEIKSRGLIYDNAEDDSLESKDIGYGITNDGIAFIHQLENQETA
jgi:hypothetical protein